MNDFIIKESQVLWYPCTLGLTGKTFLEDFLAFHNIKIKVSDGNEEPIDENYIRRRKLRQAHHEFMNDIDNPIGTPDLESYLIGSIRNHKGEKNGLLQMFNFNGPITRTEIERFYALSGFLGACIDNVFELIKTLQTLMGVQMIIERKEDATNEAHEIAY